MEPIRHTEFFDKIHFEHHYRRSQPAESLAHFIDFFWETRFDQLWNMYPNGFSDTMFPNTGYTYLINLGTPFTIRMGDRSFELKTDGFLPRHTCIECTHQPGNRLFGIKFKISPVIFEKKVNFAEYQDFIFPLSYLLSPAVVQQVKMAMSFEERVKLLSAHYIPIVERQAGSPQPAHIVTRILEHCQAENDFKTPVEEWARQAGISTRTLQRYFEVCTGLSSKKVLQILRIRKAVEHIASSPRTFHYSQYNYYDHSHFYKHLKQFLHRGALEHVKTHLRILQELHQAKPRKTEPAPYNGLNGFFAGATG
jgi:AraC-like DNA-binding protein